MAASQDTEITLGTGKMLGVFFGLVLLCAVFFGLGFSLGRSSVKPLAADLAAVTQSANAGARPSAVKPVSSPAPSNLTFYKAVEQKDGDTQSSGNTAASDAGSAPGTSAAPASDSSTAPPDPMLAVPTNGYFVQVAAVSKQEDAEALVGALKKKQYSAFATSGSPSDKLFHVQVGPFSDIKDAESVRAKLVNDGYNPILKK
ncbi:MAG: SPOR domain-containing protein [Acidobacteriia bacterium]|nr:SPOR domain-containing protein [Terriglobia bacterium]